MAFIGGTKNPKFIPFRNSNRDMQFLEWQIYLVRKISAVFGALAPGPGHRRSMSTAPRPRSSRRTPRTAVSGRCWPSFRTTSRGRSCGTPSFGGPTNNLAFRFTQLNLRETLNQAKVMEIQLARMPWRAVNEVRKEQGLRAVGPGLR